ncbi:hypothetical protein QTN25_003177 [Entamoeba marina]
MLKGLFSHCCSNFTYILQMNHKEFRTKLTQVHYNALITQCYLALQQNLFDFSQEILYLFGLMIFDFVSPPMPQSFTTVDGLCNHYASLSKNLFKKQKTIEFSQIDCDDIVTGLSSIRMVEMFSLNENVISKLIQLSIDKSDVALIFLSKQTSESTLRLIFHADLSYLKRGLNSTNDMALDRIADILNNLTKSTEFSQRFKHNTLSSIYTMIIENSITNISLGNVIIRLLSIQQLQKQIQNTIKDNKYQCIFNFLSANTLHKKEIGVSILTLCDLSRDDVDLFQQHHIIPLLCEVLETTKSKIQLEVFVQLHTFLSTTSDVSGINWNRVCTLLFMALNIESNAPMAIILLQNILITYPPFIDIISSTVSMINSLHSLFKNNYKDDKTLKLLNTCCEDKSIATMLNKEGFFVTFIEAFVSNPTESCLEQLLEIVQHVGRTDVNLPDDSYIAIRNSIIEKEVRLTINNTELTIKCLQTKIILCEKEEWKMAFLRYENIERVNYIDICVHSLNCSRSVLMKSLLIKHLNQFTKGKGNGIQLIRKNHIIRTLIEYIKKSNSIDEQYYVATIRFLIDVLEYKEEFHLISNLLPMNIISHLLTNASQNQQHIVVKELINFMFTMVSLQNNLIKQPMNYDDKILRLMSLICQIDSNFIVDFLKNSKSLEYILSHLNQKHNKDDIDEEVATLIKMIPYSPEQILRFFSPNKILLLIQNQIQTLKSFGTGLLLEYSKRTDFKEFFSNEKALIIFLNNIQNIQQNDSNQFDGVVYIRLAAFIINEIKISSYTTDQMMKTINCSLDYLNKDLKSTLSLLSLMFTSYSDVHLLFLKTSLNTKLLSYANDSIVIQFITYCIRKDISMLYYFNKNIQSIFDSIVKNLQTNRNDVLNILNVLIEKNNVINIQNVEEITETNNYLEKETILQIIRIKQNICVLEEYNIAIEYLHNILTQNHLLKEMHSISSSNNLHLLLQYASFIVNMFFDSINDKNKHQILEEIITNLLPETRFIEELTKRIEELFEMKPIPINIIELCSYSKKLHFPMQAFSAFTPVNQKFYQQVDGRGSNDYSRKDVVRQSPINMITQPSGRRYRQSELVKQINNLKMN